MIQLELLSLSVAITWQKKTHTKGKRDLRLLRPALWTEIGLISSWTFTSPVQTATVYRKVVRTWSVWFGQCGLCLKWQYFQFTAGHKKMTNLTYWTVQNLDVLSIINHLWLSKISRLKENTLTSGDVDFRVTKNGNSSLVVFYFTSSSTCARALLNWTTFWAAARPV